MRILVIGSGGREHALVWKLAQSQQVETMWCAPGNAGIAGEKLTRTGQLVTCVGIEADNLTGLLDFARNNAIDLTVVGPDNPLGMGIVDLFQSKGLRIWGPNQRAAQFEASKAFSQHFMEKYGIPTARSGIFNGPEDAWKFAESMEGKCAIKADGLALGKGVYVCTNRTEARQAIDSIMVERSFGAAGNQVVIQEYLEGMEISLHALCDGQHWRLFPTSQDHKRAYDLDQGPNTGGMGTYSPAPFLTEAQLQQTAQDILNPWLKGCQTEGIDYRGVIYPGVMLTASGPKVLEFNSRFGDPETQVYLPRLEGDLVDILLACVDGHLDKVKMDWSPKAAVCVVMASQGYPGKYEKNKVIKGLDKIAQLADCKVFHAGSKLNGQDFVTNGGRVLGVTAWSADLGQARDKAYELVRQIQFDGMQYRTDIASKALHH